MKASVSGHRKILQEFRSVRILNKIGEGKDVCFENPLEETVIRYIPGEIGKTSRYFMKCHGQNEHEIDFDSGYILTAIMQGKPISQARYDKFTPSRTHVDQA